MNLNKNSLYGKVTASFVFMLLSWGMLYLWLILIHSLGEKVAATILSSPTIYLCISLSILSVFLQKEADALIELCLFTFFLMAVFIYLIMLFSITFRSSPDIDDIIFYYECFLIIYFVACPLYLFMRIV